MKLTGQNIRHINTITHDGKVLVFGTAEGGAIYYSVKRSGFEDTAVQEGADPFGFEDWKPLALGGSTPDASVVARDRKNLTDGGGNPILRSVHGGGAGATKSADAPVQLVSAAGHVFVFRHQAPGDGGRILVNRFVLDGMTNVLVPKLEVRFRRSRQRFEPQKSATSGAGAVFDNLDYRDVDGKSFLEPALELSFAGSAANGWFAPLFVPTIESDRGRWHLFVYDGKESRIVLYTVGADAEGAFDVKDYLFGQVDPARPDVTLYRPIAGIIRRAIDLQGFTVAGGPSATTYDVQREQITDTGPQLLRDTSRVMLAVPVRAGGVDPVKTAIVDFAIATDGTLSQIDATSDADTILRSTARELITPLTLLDDIKEVANATPPPSGTIVATERGGDDLLQIRSRDPLAPELVAGSKVWVRGTQSYDGFYKVVAVDGATFRVEASFQNNEAGFWEVVPDKATGLVFDNMIVGTEKSLDGKLKVLCAAHNLSVGDELQITGTRVADGTFPIKSVDAEKKAFVLDTPFFTGQAANLSRVMRRGLRMDVGDRVDSPELGLEPPIPQRDLGRTLSAWVRIDAAGQVEQNLLRDSGGMMSLAVGADGKVKLSVRMNDAVTRTVVDPNPLQPGAWTHYAGSVDYTMRSGGDTRLALCRGGVEVTAQTIAHSLPCHLDSNLLPWFDGAQYLEVSPEIARLIAGNFTIALWVRVGGAGSQRAVLACRGAFTGITLSANADNRWEIQTGNGSAWASLLGPAAIEGAWTHVAIVVQGPTMTLYLNGAAQQSSTPTTIRTPDTVLRIGAGATEGAASFFWRGNAADVAIWKRALSPAEIAEGMFTRHTGKEADLGAYWPLDNGTGRDFARGKRHAAPKNGLTFAKAAHLHPQITPPAAQNAKKSMVMSFDGAADFVEVPAFPLPTAAMTVSAWAKSATPAWNASGCLVNKPGSFALHTVAGTRTIAALFVISGSTVTVAYTPTDIQSWHYYTGIWDGTTIRLFIDGVQVSQGNATGTLSANASDPLRIGRDAVDGAERYFKGQIADVQLWSVARPRGYIVASMNRRLTGTEQDLAGYWPLDVGPTDLSPNRRHGSLKGKPSRIADGSSFIVGGGFRGEIAEAQVWTRARPAAEVKATMHLLVAGNEPDLALDYRLGAIAFESSPPSVPDFSVNACAGVVTGEPYAGARRLNRQTGSGMKVVQYRSGELLAVSQRGLYEESLEFKVQSPDPNFDPSNADGTGLRLFSFAYWGQANRSSKETTPFPLGSVQQADFAKLDGGWWKASCRVLVPDGVSLMRAFGLVDVRGRWGTEQAPPASEWTAIDVRKHRIRNLGDTVTRADYTDQVAPATIGAPVPEAGLAELARFESEEGRLRLRCVDLARRIDVANNLAHYEEERISLKAKMSEDEKSLEASKRQRDQLVADWSSYYVRLKSDCSKLYADIQDNILVQKPDDKSVTTQWFRPALVPDAPEKCYQFISKANGKAIGGKGEEMPMEMDALNVKDNNQHWIYDGGRHMRNVGSRRLWDQRKRSGAGEVIITYRANYETQQVFTIEPSSTMTETAAEALKKLEKTIAEGERSAAENKERCDWLDRTLAAHEDATALGLEYGDAQTLLGTARKNARDKGTPLAAVSQPAALPMPAVAIDDRDLETRAAVLDLTRPSGAVRLTESVEGNVLLTYGDARGRLRVLPYDAAADSRNTSFEQWLPDGTLRACFSPVNKTDGINLDQPIELPLSGSTIEGWVQYPFTETAQSLQVLASDGVDAPLAIRNGQRLGVLIDRLFFDCGADLDQLLTPGWHHLAASRDGVTTSFYADGVRIGEATADMAALRFQGASCLNVPAFDQPDKNLTISLWARADGATWSTSEPLIVSPGRFRLAPVIHTQNVTVTFTKADNTSCSITDIAIPDPSRWHLYTLTYDGRGGALYLDGVFIKKCTLAGTLAPARATMSIGGDVAAFGGDIAEVAYWKAVRTDLAIGKDFLCRPLKGDEPDLIGYWRMGVTGDEGSRRVKDMANKSGDAVVSGAPVACGITSAKESAIRLLGVNPLPEVVSIGRLAEVRLWDAGLSGAEIAANARTFLTGNEPGLLGYFPLDEGTGVAVRNRAASGAPNGTLKAGTAPWVGFTAAVGNPASRVLGLPAFGGTSSLKCPPISLANRSFTIECWARRSSTQTGQNQVIASLGGSVTNAGLFFGFYFNGWFLMAFWGNDVATSVPYTDTDWHHWCGTYDLPTQQQRIYRDGVLVAEHKAIPGFAAAGDLVIGDCNFIPSEVMAFRGEIAELRIWDRARSQPEILASMQLRLTGAEAGLLALYPLDECDQNGRVLDRRSGNWVGNRVGNARLRISTTLPLAMSPTVTACEYSTVRVDQEGQKQAIMRRFYAGAAGGVVELLPELRVEELTLAWVGNTQINPTLLGYIEGAPPIPSENMTLQDDYDTATSVTLSTSEETSYTWTRSELQSEAFNMEGFLGVGWELEAGVGFIKKETEGSAGVDFNYEYRKTKAKESTATASSLLNTSDTLYVTGQKEDKPMSRVIGRRWIPKNIGYATVLSGMADVFVTRLRRSGRMVSYDIRPVDGVPLDVNTITFLINPAYTLNGSLDGMVGSMPADPTFYGHVPSMRAQYGSLYPASYFRLKEAYDLKNQIDQKDTARESFFKNFDANEVETSQELKATIDTPSSPTANSSSSEKIDDEAMDGLKQQMESQTQKRQKEIEARTGSIDDRARAGAAFAEWQIRMRDIQIKAGKHNIVNTYVWDADGGLHAEQQSFASTVEHSISTEISHSGGAGASVDAMVGIGKYMLKLMGSGAGVKTSGKSLGVSKTLELNVSIMGDPGIHVENNGITDLKDNPLLPGEKVGRYRFMSFYLEGSTENFVKFFREVVDPEWLMSNSEEARALRQTCVGARSQPWRVLHRVTYVERPSLKNFGK